jgi:hypothetical protein
MSKFLKGFDGHTRADLVRNLKEEVKENRSAPPRSDRGMRDVREQQVPLGAHLGRLDPRLTELVSKVGLPQ